MYAFLVFALPLAFLLLAYLLCPMEEIGSAKHAVLRGLLSAIPIWIVARLLGAIVPGLWGSPLLALHEWADRFLPYSVLPGLAYAVFYHYNKRLSPGEEERRLTAFYAGAIAPFGLGEMTRVWGNPDAYSVFIIPLLLAAIVLALPRFTLMFAGEYGARRLLPAGAVALVTLVASFVRPLFITQLWPLAWLLAGLLAAGAWFFALPGLSRRAPKPVQPSQP